MTPDPRILGAATVADLMSVLRAAPYDLPVPEASDFPDGSQLRTLWACAISVAADVGPYEYVATSTAPWAIVADIVVDQPKVLISGAPSGGPAPDSAPAAPRRRTNRARPRRRRPPPV